jgi:hypothetical protein
MTRVLRTICEGDSAGDSGACTGWGEEAGGVFRRKREKMFMGGTRKHL